jgi:hypothetical protein
VSEEYIRSEHDGRYFLSIEGCPYDENDGSIGRGSFMQTWAFQSAEARGYFIRVREAEREATRAISWLRSFKESLLECVTPSGRIRRKKLLALIERVK